MSITLIRDQIAASIAVKQAVLADDQLIAQIEKLAADCIQCLQSGGKVIFAGNGGSFSDAQHLSAEFVSRFMFDRAPLASLVLGANNSTISAIGNDFGYDQVFARELQGVARPGDVFIPITTSGNSRNIMIAVEQAKKQGLTTVALTGRGGGKLAPLCDCLCVPSRETARIQECHITIGHIVCGLVEKGYFSEPAQ
ncbi:MAG: D-sedoheptulose 7-phosphate isomerase [Gammaproteobacteria bacterium]|nr:D-sedoheptulose 7-phosphate isomerase [Gammaproteobacteria bacterium]